MQFRIVKSGYLSLVMFASPLLALALGGVGWASICSPGVSPFLELDGNVGFSSAAGASFDWANSGANSQSCGYTTNPISCTGTGGVFNDSSGCTASGVPNACCTGSGTGTCGSFVNSTTPPIPPTETAAAKANTSIVAAQFAADPLSVDSSTHCRFQVETPCSGNSSCQQPSTAPPKFCTCGDKQGQSCGTDTDCTGCKASATNKCGLDTCVACSGDPTAYTGTGSETNGDLLSSDTFGKSGTLPDKDDIANVYAIAHQNPANPDPSQCTSCTAGGDSCNATNEVFAGFERVVNSGDSHVDLEFLQATVGLVQDNASDVCSGHFTGDRTKGDFLLSVDFTVGGTTPNLKVYRWNCGSCTGPVCNPGCNTTKGSTPPSYVELTGTEILPADQPGLCSNNPQISCTTGNTAPCGAGATCNIFLNAITQVINSGLCSGSGTPCARDSQCPKPQTCNGGTIGCGGWACRNKDGTQTPSTIGLNEFYELGVDLAGIGFSGCISTFLPHTRTSQSFTAVLKDFTIVPFNTCVPSTKLTKVASATSVVTGGSVTYTYAEQNDGNVQLSNPTVTDDKCTPVSVDNTSTACTAAMTPFSCCSGSGTGTCGDTNANSKLDPGETWTFTCSKTLTKADCATQSNMCTVTNTATGHATFIPPGSTVGKDVTFCPDPNNPPPATFCDQDERAMATVTVLTPSTSLTKSETHSVKTTVNYTFTETNDGKVALIPPGGTTHPESIIVDSKCAATDLTFDSGDTNSNGILDPGETWTVKCTKTFDGTGPFSNTAVGHGCFPSNTGSGNRDVTIGTAAALCGTGSSVFVDGDETASKTVNACP